MIIDAHHHLWQTARNDYHWMRREDVVLSRDYMPADLYPILYLDALVVKVRQDRSVRRNRPLPVPCWRKRSRARSP